MAILPATRKILSLLEQDPKAITLPTLLDFVNRFGSDADADALYEVFLETKAGNLLDPITFHGSTALGNDLFEKAISNGGLNPDYPSDVLLTLAYLQHPEMEAILISYYQNLFADRKDWDLHTNVCLGLLNYSCKGYEEQLREAIAQCLKIHLFPDLIPVLAHKLDDQHLNAQLIQHATEVASTSCISGILLNTALAGAAYREVFKAMIWNKELEATYSGIGNAYFTFQGMHAQQLSISELYNDFLTALQAQDESVDARLCILHDLMETKLNEPVQYPIRGFKKLEEDLTALYRFFFAWKANPNKDETIIGLIGDYTKKNPEFESRGEWHKTLWYKLQDQYQLKVENEILLTLVTN